MTLESGSPAQAFALAEDALELPHGSIRCTVLIETILAAFEMDALTSPFQEFLTLTAYDRLP